MSTDFALLWAIGIVGIAFFSYYIGRATAWYEATVMLEEMEMAVKRLMSSLDKEEK